MKKAMSFFQKGVLAASIFAGGASAQEVNIQERIEYYDISGRTPEQLLQGMIDNSPIAAYSGAKHFAVAESYYTWSYDLSPSDGRCELESYRVAVDMLYVMPRWIDRERGRKRLVNYWAAFEQNLWVHERGHGDIALAIGAEMVRAMGKTPAVEDCAVMREDVRRAAETTLKELDDKQKEYDKVTKHGQLQGAFFDVGAAK